MKGFQNVNKMTINKVMPPYIFDLPKDLRCIYDIWRWSPVSALAEIPLGGRGPRNLIKGEEEGGGGGGGAEVGGYS